MIPMYRLGDAWLRRSKESSRSDLLEANSSLRPVDMENINFNYLSVRTVHPLKN